MAVLASGKILLQGNPHQLVGELTEKIWTKTVSQAQAQELEAQLPVISKRLLAGRTVLNVMAETCPEGFTPATACLLITSFAQETRLAGNLQGWFAV
jgi:hypothetical protein